MNKKIIHILCHSLENNSLRDHHVFGNWAARLAKNISHYSNIYKNEVWYPIHNLDKRISFTKDKITYKLYPAKTAHRALESYFAIIKCDSLFAELKLQNPKTTIIHFQGERGNLLHKVLSQFSQFYITIQYHGYGQPLWLEWLEKILIKPLEKKNFLQVSHFFVHIRKRIEYLKRELHIPKEKISYQNVGIDFDIFKPASKIKARKDLNIPVDRFVLLYVGHMISSKGVDKIIKAYKILKVKYPQLYLLFVGAEKTDPLYEDALKTADRVEENLENSFLPSYYNAADVFCFFGNAKTKEYAGPGTALMEAMASNLNAVSTNIIHFPDRIIKEIGMIPKNFDDLVGCIEYLIQNPKIKFNARKKIEPYTSYKSQTTHLLKIYAEFFAKKY